MSPAVYLWEDSVWLAMSKQFLTNQPENPNLLWLGREICDSKLRSQVG